MMRTVTTNHALILPLLDTGCSKFAMWVRSPKDELPQKFNIAPKSKSVVGIWIIYPHLEKLVAKPVKVNDAVQLYVYGNGKIVGADLPVRKFHAELRNLIMWLREQIDQINSESSRINYRVVANLLHQHAEELFLPPQ